MLNRFWQGVLSMMNEAPATPGLTLPVCDLAVTDVARVRELLSQLVGSRFSLILLGEDGVDLGTARVFSVSGEHLTLERSGHTGDTFCGKPLRANAAGSSPQGALMFTLNLLPSRLNGLWRALLPRELLCVQ